MTCSSMRLNMEIGAMECSKRSWKDLMLLNLKDKIGFIEKRKGALRALRYSIHTGVTKTPFEVHHG